MNSLRCATTVAASLLSALALAGPAHAELGGYDDPADATASLTDIHALSVDHGPKRIKISLLFADLQATSEAGPAGLTVYLDADRDEKGPDLALTTGLQAGTDYQLVETTGWQLDDEPLTCPHSVKLVPAEDVVRIVVARSCLGSPDEVRVGAKMVDEYDGSHPVVDWFRGTRRFTPWLESA
jgi:hypothetical protein